MLMKGECLLFVHFLSYFQDTIKIATIIMKNVSYYLLGLALLMLALMGLHLKGLFDAAVLEKDKVDQQISSAVCHSFEQLATTDSDEINVRACAKLGNDSFRLTADSDKDRLPDMIRQQLQMEDQIPFPYQVSLGYSIGENDLPPSKFESEDSLQTAFVHIDMPPLRKVILTGWGTDFILLILISGIMIWIYYNITAMLYNYELNVFTSKVENLKIGQYSFDVKNQALRINGKQRRMTTKECQVLAYLYTNKNQITRRDAILRDLWGENDYFKGRSLDVFIARLRKYLSDDDTITIETVHGVGFILMEK